MPLQTVKDLDSFNEKLVSVRVCEDCKEFLVFLSQNVGKVLLSSLQRAARLADIIKPKIDRRNK